MSLKRARSPSAFGAEKDDDDDEPPIYRSAPLTDRQSTFVAHFSPTLAAPALQAHPAFRTATHRIAAWRRPSAQRSLLGASARVLETGFDDDGERHAGRRLARVLEGLGVEGAVCVARWYGGVMLGPRRFEHVENCAREAVRAWRAATAAAAAATMKGGGGAGAGAGAVKRVKVGEGAGARDKGELEKVLEARDRSIEVLRGLLAEKKRVVGREDGAAGGAAKPATPKKPMDYKAMPVQALVKLEKARDATIAFILKELDKVEDEILNAMGDDEEPDESDTMLAAEAAQDGRSDEKEANEVAAADHDSNPLKPAKEDEEDGLNNHESSSEGHGADEYTEKPQGPD